MERQILTTTVGSYPIPEWLPQPYTTQALHDAMMMMFHLQELAGLELVTTGEFRRFDANHPATNGMIDYFIRPLQNVRTVLTRGEERMFRDMPSLGFRDRPA